MAALVALLSGCGGSSSGDDMEFTGTGFPGVDLANTRNVKAAIDSSNVSKLEEAWTLPLEAQSTYGAYASTPIIDKGVIYSQDLVSDVQAISLADGEVQWEKTYESPTHGPNGLVVDDGLVFGATATDAFALDQESGKEVWSVPLTRSSTESIDMAPGYHEGLVYVSTVPVTATETYGPGAAGTLWALDGKSGKKVWHFDTVPKSLWGNPQVNSGGGLWYPPSFDEKGSIYFGTGNPGPLPGTPKDPWGSSRPGPNLYADSMVKLDEKTGKMDWYYQHTPHNIYDWDFQNPPVLVNAGGRDLAIGSGKSGVVVALDAKTGRPVWKQPVGTHNGHDNDPLYAMRGEYSKIKPGEAFPGTLGGVIAPLATDGKSVYVPIVNHSMTVVSGSELSESSAATGEMVALDLATGKFKWKKQLPAPAYGAPTVVNDLVFETTSDGTIYVLDTKSGGEVSQLKLPAGTNAGVMANGEYLIGAAGLPLEEGQIPELVAYKLGG
ncbi:MAG TPA: PQQ-binding-like beta-propeller repeat protein [Solirubrobacterales bacterium]|nr:PQQ-binding-like beta-propeller repeat protein [Solirubrobacterales bacterium]